MSDNDPKQAPEPIPRENPFLALSRMIKGSVGRLPAHLVIIFLFSLSLTVLCGVILQLSVKNSPSRDVYLPERLNPQADKPALEEAALAGVWVHSSGGYSATLRLGGGVFEIIVRHGSSSTSRYFIRGGYRIEGDVLMFQQRKDLGTPIDPDHFEYEFYPLELSDINLYAEIDGPLMMWRTPVREMARQDNPEQAVRVLFSTETLWAKIFAKP